MAMETLKRILISDAPQKVGETVKIDGWVSVRRDHGKIVFIDLRDRSESVQLVVVPVGNDILAEAVKDVRSEYILEITGLVKARPGKKECLVPTDIEIEVRELTVLGRPVEELPIDVSSKDFNLNLETLLNNRTIALRNEKVQAIFKIYSELCHAYSEAMYADGFVEIKTPKILSAATEGGANFFKIKYFDREAFLAQSPQFYKQAAMSAFERVFEIGTVFRAEPHFTTRHVNEYTGFDAEMGFIENLEDVMAELEKTMYAMFQHLKTVAGKELALFGVNVPDEVPIPRMKLSEAFELLKKEYGKELEGGDIDSEGERMIGDYVKSKTRAWFKTILSRGYRNQRRRCLEGVWVTSRTRYKER
jgi:nondiscriminating aspartyl-tRNA synthetase